MELTVRVSTIDDVLAFRCSPVAFNTFVPSRAKAEVNIVGLEYTGPVQKIQFTGVFFDEDLCDCRPSIAFEFG